MVPPPPATDIPASAAGSSTCSCTCLCCGPASAPSASWRRLLKRKLDQIDEDHLQQHQLPVRSNDATATIADVSARVEIENEAAVLRETLSSHQQSIQELYEELEEERSAAATAASEAMSMILRLQREKAEAQMEFRQFKRFAEEKMSHDQEEIAVLEDLLFKRDQAVQSLTCEIQAYKHRLMSYGLGPTLSEPQTPDTATALNTAAMAFDYPPLRTPDKAASALNAAAAAFDYPPLRTPDKAGYALNATAAAFDYPPLRCRIPNDHDNDDPPTDLEKYAFGETPRDQIQNLEQRIHQMESMPSSSHEKGVIAFSPQKPWHSRRLSVDSFDSGSFTIKGEDRRAERERDDASDRVYTVDRVHCVPESYIGTPRGAGRVGSGKDCSGMGEIGDEEEEIKRLNLRLQALEADRETMRQTMLSMGKDQAQLVLLKEIAQQLCKEATPSAQQQQKKKLDKKRSFIRSISIVSAMKWITSFVFWRRKAARTKYTFGITNNNAGLLMLLEKSPWLRQKRCLTRTLR